MTDEAARLDRPDSIAVADPATLPGIVERA